MTTRERVDSVSVRQKSFANRKQRSMRGKSAAAAIAPVFKQRNVSFSSVLKQKDLLIHYYQQTITRILKCAGLGKVEIQNLLAQIDFLLNDEQHETLRTSKLLDNKATKDLQKICKDTNEVLQNQQKTRAAVVIQSKVRGWLVRKRMRNLTMKDKGIIRVRTVSFNEFLCSEEAYLQTVDEMIRDYIRPIQENASRFNISAAAVHYLVRDIEKLFTFNETFLRKLCSIRDHSLFPICMSIGNEVTANSADLRTIYLGYTNNYIARTETFRHLLHTNPKFQHFIAEKQQSSEPLENLLELPLQYLQVLAARLRMIHSCCPPSLKDEKFNIGRSIGVVESINLGCSKILDEQYDPDAFEDIKQTLIVELSLEGLKEPLLGTPKRSLVKEGPVRLSKKKSPAHMYLFTDMIILAEKNINSPQLKYLRTIYPGELSITSSGTKIQLLIEDCSGNSNTETLSFKNNKLEWITALEEFVERYEKNRVYGVMLDTIIERENIPDEIPFVLAITIKYIRSYGMNTEGIFRVPGDGMKVEVFKRLFDSGATEVDFRGCSVHDVAALLKLYLRELPTPLIPHEYYTPLIKLQNDLLNQMITKDNYKEEIAKILVKVPPCNRQVLIKLVDFLVEMATHEKETKMGTKNLAMVFSPNIIRPVKDTIDTAMQSAVVSKIFEFIMVHLEELLELGIRLNPRLAMYSCTKHENENTREKKSRYSLDAFEPLLANEIPLLQLPVTKAQLNLVRLDSFCKSPKKKKFEAKNSPRREELHPFEECEITQSKSEWRRSRSMNALGESLAILAAQGEHSLENLEDVKDKPTIRKGKGSRRTREGPTTSSLEPKTNSGSFWSIISPRSGKKK